MKTRFLFSPLTAVALLALPIAAWADRNPDFEDDALPILETQPGLVDYVHSHFDVKDTGKAKYPGNDDQAPRPPYIFRARPRGADGPYFLRLLIQPGPPNHILNVVDMNKVHLNDSSAPEAPEPQSMSPAGNPVAPRTLPPYHPATTAKTPAASSTTQQATASMPTTEPTSDTPSGPITAPAGSSTTLAPPPDPAPTH